MTQAVWKRFSPPKDLDAGAQNGMRKALARWRANSKQSRFSAGT
jgi:hypothetical protein